MMTAIALIFVAINCATLATVYIMLKGMRGLVVAVYVALNRLEKATEQTADNFGVRPFIVKPLAEGTTPLSINGERYDI